LVKAGKTGGVQRPEAQTSPKVRQSAVASPQGDPLHRSYKTAERPATFCSTRRCRASAPLPLHWFLRRSP